MRYNKENHDQIIKKSHERSQKYGIEKERTVSKRILKGDAISSTMQSNKELVKIASPFMKDLYDFLIDSGFFIILTDKKGCILNMIGDTDILKAAHEMDMIIGAYMDEENIGTNAMGTAINEDVPIQVSAKEHFIAAYHKWTCSAAPIHNEKGEIIGTLNLTGSSELVHLHTLGLVVAAVNSIESQMKTDRAQHKVLEANQYMKAVMDSISSGIFAVDGEGIIRSVNATGCSMLQIKKERLLYKSVNQFLVNWKEIYTCFESGKAYQDEEIQLPFQDKKERYNINAYPIKNEQEEIIGMVIMLKEIQKVINLVNKYTGGQARYDFEDIIGDSEEIRKVIAYAKQVSCSPSTVLIEGESGTGKELLAQSIHNESDRRECGFVAINCGAIPQNLIESELFGYDDGAFTGAKRGGHPGKFELANGGTLFLDEIGEMPLEMQVRLLRVLQEYSVTRVGGNKVIPVDVRIIAATNKDLRREVAKGTFRQDLYYRLSVIPIILPPLRERIGDVEYLMEHFLKEKARKLQRKIPLIHNSLKEKLIGYSWPGNIRELENVVENIVNFNGDTTFSIDGSEQGQKTNKKEFERKESNEVFSLEEVEKRAIENAIKVLEGNMTKVAKTLGISRNTLYCKIKKYRIH